jgi:hypothetical protein
MKKIVFISISAFLLTGTPLAAQTVDQVTVVHAGRLLDKPGSAPSGPSTVIIRNGKIVESYLATNPAQQARRLSTLRTSLFSRALSIATCTLIVMQAAMRP